MSFYRKYELERLVQKAEPKTFRAREVSTGQAVYLHMLGGLDAAARRPLLDKALALLAAHNPAILDVDDSQFAPYVVTNIIEEFAGLPAWLERIPMGAPQAPPHAAAPRSKEDTVTKTMEMSALLPKGASPSPAAPPAAPAPPAVRAVPPAQQAPPRQTPVAPVPPVAGPMPAASSGAEPGEFTKMFGGAGAKAAAAPPPVQTPPPPAARSSAAPPPLSPRMQPPAAPMPPAAAPSGGSEFSRIFGSSNPPAATPGSAESGEFTRMFGAPPPAPSDNPAGFSPAPPPKPAPEVPLPWEPRAAAPVQPLPQTPSAASYPKVETPDTQKLQAATRPPLVPPTPPPVVQQPAPQPPQYEGAASMWNSPPPAGSGAGEFTQFFGSPMAASSLPIEEIERGRMPEARAPADKPFGGPGEFTRFFGSNKPGENPPPPQTPAQFATFSGRATGLFNAPMAGGQSGSPIAPAQGPSEFTRQMNRGDLLPPEPVAYVPGNAGKPGRGAMIAVIVAIVVVLVLLGVTLILMLRH